MSGKPGQTNDDLSAPSARGPRRRTVGFAAAIAIAVVLLLVGLGGGYALGNYLGGKSSNGNNGSQTTSYTISETGSSLVYPLMNLWGPNFTKLYPNVQVTAQSTGSGTGISSAESGTVDIGATDAYLTPTTATNYSLINLPVAISAQLVYYNIPGVSTNLNLNGSVMAKIYSGVITNWNDPLIQAANPSVSLPNLAIVPIHRQDGSGDTALFTEYCYLSWSGWTYGYGTTVTWISGSPGATGNSGMVTTLQHTTGGVAYIGISYESSASAAGLTYAALGDQAANVNGTDPSNYVLPTAANIGQDASLGLVNLAPPSVAICLILGGVPGATNLQLGHGGTMPTVANPTPYPIVNLEYTLEKTTPSDAAKQKWVVAFLEWALAYGNSATYMNQVHFLPLPPAIVGYDMQALQAVSVSA